MTNRNMLLGRSRPREKLSKEEIATLDKVAVPPAPPAKPKPTGKKGGGPQRMVRRGDPEVSMEPRVPRLRFQGRRRRPAPARAAPGEVRPLQAGPGPWAVDDCSINRPYVNFPGDGKCTSEVTQGGAAAGSNVPLRVHVAAGPEL